MSKEKSAKSIQDRLAAIQVGLHVPKGQRNKFGNYDYRNCEDVLQAAKPLLDGGFITLTDEVVLVGERYYIKAEAKLTFQDESISVFGWAREAVTKKGMDESQITGSTSSYARKYALNGLLAIDNTPDADSMDNSQPSKPQAKPAAKPKPPVKKEKPVFTELQTKLGQDLRKAGIDPQEWAVKNAVGAWADLTDDACANYLMALEGGQYHD